MTVTASHAAGLYRLTFRRDPTEGARITVAYDGETPQDFEYRDGEWRPADYRAA